MLAGYHPYQAQRLSELLQLRGPDALVPAVQVRGVRVRVGVRVGVGVRTRVRVRVRVRVWVKVRASPRARSAGARVS